MSGKVKSLRRSAPTNPTTFALSAREEKLIASVKVWLDGMGDLVNASTDAMWGENETAPEVPPWVRVVARRLDRTLFAPATAALDKLELTPYRAGFACGMLEWVQKRFERPIDPALRALNRKLRLSARAKRKLSKLVESFLIRAGFITKREIAQSRYIPRKIERYRDRVQRGPIHDLVEFRRGQADGIQGYGPGTPGDRTDLSTDILFLLGMFWRVVVRFRSVTDLHLWLTRLLGPQKVGDKKRVEKICERVGLSFRKRGRPRKNPTLLLTG